MTQPKKEHYRRKLPNYQQPGQWYSVTFTLKGAMPKGAMAKYTTVLEIARTRLEELRSQESDNPLYDKRDSDFPKSEILQLGKLKSGESEFLNSDKSATLESCSPDLQVGNLQSRLAEAKKEYQIALRKYRLAYDKVLNNSILPGINLLKEENRKIIEEALLFWEGKRMANHAWCIMRNHVHWIITVFDREAGTGASGVGVSNSDTGKSDNLLSGSSFSATSESCSPDNSSSATSESCSPDQRDGNQQSRESEFPNSDIFDLGKSKSQPKPVYLQDILHSVKLFTARRINENENLTGQLWEHESFDTTIRNDRHFMNVFNYVIQNPVSAGLVENWPDWPGTRTFQSP